MTRRVSDDLKARIPVLFHEGFSVGDICHLLGINEGLAHNVLNNYHRLGTVSSRTTERNDLARALYMNKIAELAPDPNMLMFVDGTARSEGAQRRSVRGTRYSIVPVVTLDGIIAYDIAESPVGKEKFVSFLKEQVMQFTTPYPGPRSVFIMDGSSVHRGEDIRRLVDDDCLCKLVYLPPYSPDYNPAEQAFSGIESYLHYHSDDSPLMSTVRACQSITPDRAEGYFRASGYVVEAVIRNGRVKPPEERTASFLTQPSLLPDESLLHD